MRRYKPDTIEQVIEQPYDLEQLSYLMEFLEHHQLMMIEIKVLVVVEENLLFHNSVPKLVMVE